jgi:2-oxoisovalerate dehydrogenase E1 component
VVSIAEHSAAPARRSADASALYAVMSLIRRTEETLLELFGQGELSGTTHTSIGQEAIAAGLATHLGPDDVWFSTHRCHGHYLAYGGPLEELFAEVMGRESALSAGRGGSQHLHFRGFYSNGVQGGVPGNATGIALAERLRGTGRVVVATLGDGTFGEGLVYESLNFAALHSLPILFLVEDNGYAQSTPSRLTLSGSITARAEAFGISASRTEDADPVALAETLGERIASVRAGGPYLQVVRTYRLAPHSKGDDDRDPAEIEAARARDPLAALERSLPEGETMRMRAEAEERVRAAVEVARARPAARDGALQLVPAGPYPPAFAREPRRVVASLNAALGELLAADERVFLLGEDMLDPYGGAFKVTRGLSSAYPQRVVPTPLSEAGIVAWATGAALAGARPVAEIMFGDFVTLAADQLVNHAGKYRWMYGDGVRVNLVVRTPMGGRRGYGPTHSQSLEAMFCGVPGLCVVAPSHLVEPGELLRRSVEEVEDPVLFVEHKLLYTVETAPVRDGRVGPFFVRQDGACFPTLHLSLAGFERPDWCLFAYGGNAPLALEAATELLERHEVLCDVVVPSQLSPLPELAVDCNRVAVLEEGPRAHGWGAELVAGLAERGTLREVARFGGPDVPIPASKSLEAELLPGLEGIVARLAR